MLFPKHILISKRLAALMPFRPRGGTLVVSLCSMGDLLLASGAIARIAERSEGPVYVIIEDYAEPVTGILNLPNVRWITVGRGSLFNMLHLFPVFRRRWDRVVHLTFSTTSYAHEICAATTAKDKIWFNGERSDYGEKAPENVSSIYTQIIPVERDTHELDKMSCLLRAIGCPCEARANIYPVMGAEVGRQRSEVGGHGSRRDRIVICPGGRFPQKKWADIKYAQLIQKLAERMPEVEFCLLGGPGDVDACNEIEKASPDARGTNLCGKLSLRASVQEISESSLCIGNDSFALHAAIAVGTPSVVIMGGGDYPRWIPWKDTDEHRMVTGDCEHQGCGWKCVFGDYRCVKDITAHDVLSETLNLNSMGGSDD